MPTGRAVIDDAALEAVREAGATAADSVSVFGYGTIGFLGGFVGTFTLPVAILIPESPFPVIAAGGLYSVVLTRNHAARSSTELSAAQRAQIEGEPPAAQQLFRMAYRERLRERRVRASWWGSGIGAGVAVGTMGYLLYLLSNTDF